MFGCLHQTWPAHMDANFGCLVAWAAFPAWPRQCKNSSPARLRGNAQIELHNLAWPAACNERALGSVLPLLISPPKGKIVGLVRLSAAVVFLHSCDVTGAIFPACHCPQPSRAPTMPDTTSPSSPAPDPVAPNLFPPNPATRSSKRWRRGASR